MNERETAMNRKIWPVFFTVLLAFAFAACGDDDDANRNVPTGELAFAGADFTGTAGTDVPGMNPHANISATFAPGWAGSGLRLFATDAITGTTGVNFVTTAVNLNSPGNDLRVNRRLTFYMRGNYTATDGSSLILLFSTTNSAGDGAGGVVITGKATAYSLRTTVPWGTDSSINLPDWTKITIHLVNFIGATEDVTGNRALLSSHPLKIRGRNIPQSTELFFDEFRYE
jgi:hypothetical protein